MRKPSPQRQAHGGAGAARQRSAFGSQPWSPRRPIPRARAARPRDPSFPLRCPQPAWAGASPGPGVLYRPAPALPILGACSPGRKSPQEGPLGFFHPHRLGSKRGIKNANFLVLP